METMNKDLEFRKIFGKRLKMLRIERNLTLKELAAAISQKYDISISYGSIANYERAFRIPSLSLLSYISDFLEVTNDFLLGQTDVRNAKVIQTTVFDNEDNSHIVKVAVDKYSNLSDRPFSEIIELVEKLKELGFNLERKTAK